MTKRFCEPRRQLAWSMAQVILARGPTSSCRTKGGATVATGSSGCWLRKGQRIGEATPMLPTEERGRMSSRRSAALPGLWKQDHGTAVILAASSRRSGDERFIGRPGQGVRPRAKKGPCPGCLGSLC